MLTKFKNVIYEQEGDVATIRLNRPKVNALVPELYDDLMAALDNAKNTPEVRAIILEGEGRCFSVGADIKEVPAICRTLEGHMKLVTESLQKTARTMRAVNKPIIAACHVYCLGGALETALNADIIIAAEGCKFGFPEAGVGTTVARGVTKTLPLLVGLAKAKELIFTCDFIDAREAERIGLVNKVVPLADMHMAAMELAKRIAKNYPLAVRSVRSALNRGAESSFESTLEFETYLALASHDDEQKGMIERAQAIEKGKGEK